MFKYSKLAIVRAPLLHHEIEPGFDLRLFGHRSVCDARTLGAQRGFGSKAVMESVTGEIAVGPISNRPRIECLAVENDSTSAADEPCDAIHNL
jgi:hypothetical protein